ncbi:MAG: hypothetical protein AB7U73_01180 [Pirellulales bacterium]
MDAAGFPLIDFRAADILAFSGRSRLSRLIKAATVPPWYWFRAHWRCVNHVAILARLKDDDGTARLFAIEATTQASEPCAITHRLVSGVQAHLPTRLVASYPGYVFRARINWASKVQWTEHQLLSDFLQQFVGQPYDYLDAVRSATGRSHLPSLKSLFCSEVVAAALVRIGRLPADQAPDRYTPAKLMKRLVYNGIYDTPVRIK